MTNYSLNIIYKYNYNLVTDNKLQVKIKLLNKLYALINPKLKGFEGKCNYTINISDDIKDGQKVRLKNCGYRDNLGNTGDLYIEISRKEESISNSTKIITDVSDKANSFYTSFMNSPYWRNTVSKALKYIGIGICLYLIYYFIMTPIKMVNYYYASSFVIIFMILGSTSNRLWVENVCPICFENRAIERFRREIGKPEFIMNTVRGDYNYAIYRATYEDIVRCRYCTYCEVSPPYEEEISERLDLTEEAKLRIQREQDEIKMQQLQKENDRLINEFKNSRR